MVVHVPPPPKGWQPVPWAAVAPPGGLLTLGGVRTKETAPGDAVLDVAPDTGALPQWIQLAGVPGVPGSGGTFSLPANSGPSIQPPLNLSLM